MRALMNARMRDMIESKQVRELLSRSELADDLQALLGSGFVEADGCFLLRAFVGPGFSAERALERFPDRTGCEMSVNHIHIEDMLGTERQWEPLEVFAQGYAYARHLAQLLEARGHFKVIFSFREDADDIGGTVGFHRARPGEAWLAADLEGYREEAVLLLETQGQNQE